MSNEENEKFVRWRLFKWIIGFIILVIISLSATVTNTRLDVRELRTDVKWIRQALEDYKEANGGVLDFYDIMNNKKL